MLGGGNPVGGSFTGPAQALEIIGDNAYAYSGVQVVNNNLSKVIKFTSGNYYFVGGAQFFKDSVSSENYEFKVNFNDVAIVHGEWTEPMVQHSGFYPVQFIIPPYTQVEITLQNTSDTVSRNWTTTLIGKIVRTRD